MTVRSGTPRTPRKLGKRQSAVMECMYRHRQWPSGFIYGSDSETDRILVSLWRRGLVIRTGTTSSGYGSYTLPELSDVQG